MLRVITLGGTFYYGNNVFLLPLLLFLLIIQFPCLLILALKPMAEKMPIQWPMGLKLAFCVEKRRWVSKVYIICTSYLLRTV